MSTVRADAALRKLPGEEGIWVFILGDLAMFTLFFGTFIYYRQADLSTFQAGRLALSTPLGAVNTLLLLTSSWFVARALESYRTGTPQASRRGLLLAALCGMAFVADKVYEYSHLLARDLGPGSNDFFLFFFILTGIHLGHVLIGLGVLWWLRRRTANPADPASGLVAFECGAIFWHLVDLLWIILFALLYLLP